MQTKRKNHKYRNDSDPLKNWASSVFSRKSVEMQRATLAREGNLTVSSTRKTMNENGCYITPPEFNRKMKELTKRWFFDYDKNPINEKKRLIPHPQYKMVFALIVSTYDEVSYFVIANTLFHDIEAMMEKPKENKSEICENINTLRDNKNFWKWLTFEQQYQVTEWYLNVQMDSL